MRNANEEFERLCSLLTIAIQLSENGRLCMRTLGLSDAASEAAGRLPPLAGTLAVLGRTGCTASSLAGSLGWGFLSCFCMLHSRSARPVASSQIEHRQSGRSVLGNSTHSLTHSLD